MGKPRDRELDALHTRYADRLKQLGVEYNLRIVPETRAGGRYSDDHVKEREAAALRDALEPRGQRVALDPRGKLLDSPGLAERLERWATPELSLILGGPLGLHETLRREADHCWSLSPLTFTHELARVLVAEQLYRAMTILRGIPYHK